MKNISENLLILIIALLFSEQNRNFVCATHITGSFNPNRNFFKFLVKFGFQKTERHSQKDSYGYIYGNITSDYNFLVPLTFAVLDKGEFLDFYDNRTLANKEKACQKMFSNLDRVTFDKSCNVNGKSDYLRKVPCKVGEICPDEDDPKNLVPGNQFTYVISDLNSPKFWYVALVACYHDIKTCKWHAYDHSKFRKSINDPQPIIRYDIRLVNGNPQQQFNLLTFHFSFDQQNIFEMYMIFFIIYLILVPMQFYAVRVQKHPVTKLFTLSLMLEFVSLCFLLYHTIRFALNGVGNESLKTAGDIFDIFSRASFMLILLLLAKGWAVTRQQISRLDWILLMIIWIPYCGFNVFLYVWNRTEVDIISDVDEYQTWPGWLVLACRCAFMLWFLYELRNTMKYEHSTKKLDFLLHFGASSLVWFIYLPIVALIALQVSPLWRYKLLLGITNSADCLAYCVMTGLLWPNRSGQYLLLAGQNFAGMDELDEFNEAPHIVHGDTNLPPHILPPDPLCRNNNDFTNADNRNLLDNGVYGGDSSYDILNSDNLVLNDDDDDEYDDIFVHHNHNLLQINGESIDLSKNKHHTIA